LIGCIAANVGGEVLGGGERVEEHDGIRPVCVDAPCPVLVTKPGVLVTLGMRTSMSPRSCSARRDGSMSNAPMVAWVGAGLFTARYCRPPARRAGERTSAGLTEPGFTNSPSPTLRSPWLSSAPARAVVGRSGRIR
jgi:hypothetical protein